VIARLKTLFKVYESGPPVAIVLMGNFLSILPGAQYASRLKTAMKDFAEMLQQYPYILQNCHFVFIPGPSDPGSPLIFPRCENRKVIVQFLRLLSC